MHISSSLRATQGLQVRRSLLSSPMTFAAAAPAWACRALSGRRPPLTVPLALWLAPRGIFLRVQHHNGVVQIPAGQQQIVLPVTAAAGVHGELVAIRELAVVQLIPTDVAFDPAWAFSLSLQSIQRAAPPFNRPTGVVVGPT